MEENIGTKKNICIIYHYPCYDGLYGAINTYLYYKNFTNNKYNITFLPLRNIYPIFSKLTQRYDKIISLDLGMKENDIDFLKDINNSNISVTIFDHHESWHEQYKKEYEPILLKREKFHIIFDETNSKSACGLSFDYYKNKALKKENIETNKVEEIFSDELEKINSYIEDSDTGKFSLKFIHEFKSGLSEENHIMQTDLTINPTKTLNKFLSINVSFLIKVGERYLKKTKKKSKNILLNNWIYVVELKGGYKFLMCITKDKYVRNFACPFLGKISKKKGYLPIGALVYSYSKGQYKFSMRAGDDSVDVSKIANEYGGGGHKGAAAFIMDYEGIDNLIVKTINIKKDIQNMPI